MKIDNTDIIVKLFNDSREVIKTPELACNTIKCIVRKKDTDEVLMPLYNGAKTRTERVIYNAVVNNENELRISLEACKTLADCIPGLRVYYGVDVKSTIKTLVEMNRNIMSITEDIISTKGENLPLSQFSLGHKILGIGSSCINKASTTLNRDHMYYVLDCDLESEKEISTEVVDEFEKTLLTNNIKTYRIHTPNGYHLVFPKMDFIREFKHKEELEARKKKIMYATTKYTKFMGEAESYGFNLLNNAMTLVYFNK